MRNNIPLTRSELLAVRSRIKLAIKGHSLLKKKQDFLINEFFKKVREYKAFKRSIAEETRQAYEKLALDIAYNGVTQSRSVAYATKDVYDMLFAKDNVMGVLLPRIELKATGKPEATAESSPLLAEVTREFRDLFVKVIQLSSMRLAIEELGDEIKKIKRRVNSLEHIQIPKLEDVRDMIVFVLGEQEREAFTRLKMIKQRLSA